LEEGTRALTGKKIKENNNKAIMSRKGGEGKNPSPYEGTVRTPQVLG